MSKRFALVLVALVVIFGGIFFVSKHKASAPVSNNSSAAPATQQASNHTMGDGKKNVSLVEYGDYQCPGCTAYYPIIKQVVEKHKSDITFQFVNYPLVQLHQNAMAAHRAAEAAGLQGKYWEMHDLLYEQHDSWATSTNVSNQFQDYAMQLGLNVDQFKKDFASSSVNDIINADVAKGRKLGVSGTPTFFLNGKEIKQNPQDVDGFNKLIDNAIANKQ